MDSASEQWQHAGAVELRPIAAAMRGALGVVARKGQGWGRGWGRGEAGGEAAVSGGSSLSARFPLLFLPLTDLFLLAAAVLPGCRFLTN